ncbi:murein transglycosylase A [Flaviflagellibacter deserti]|uniref:peptidoglycan lytic exotransglycosylase n=1 Tax=Flaviflagellibacter deserti TaxID=2267266 RepID=A0ABV9Z633_9HYPH
MAAARAAGAALAILIASVTAAGAQPSGVSLAPVSFAALPGWAADDQSAAFATFVSSCRKPKPGPVLPAGRSLKAACLAALHENIRNPAATRTFFERHFEPFVVNGADNGFYTGYFEPEFTGSPRRNAVHSEPLLALPRKMRNPAPDRAAIEGGAFSGQKLELVWLDPVDAFFVHIQGSARIRLDDGKVIRVRFAGRNGLPFTPIGRVLVQRGELTLEQADMAGIRAWLAAHPDQARALMRENKSYIFFRPDTGRAAEAGPIGGSGLALTAGRSIAIDDQIWPYGIPVWIDAPLPSGDFRRLTVAQDTGAAIKGAARADIFLGAGVEAGAEAGQLKHSGTFVVLLPRRAGR